MLWLFAQVWLLCAVAFLAGAAATWLAFVRPRRPGPAGGGHPRRRPADWLTAAPGTPERPPLPATPPAPVEPAIAVLDTRRGPTPRRTGTSAADALDELGVPTQRTPDDLE
ncbi:hypothetical protein BJF78_05045 [Pseudonocardia sp. CNS-139]|nr:hypothetical protein BJF78_05045 [Pseudonocardia sp. CNS-139]